MLDATLQHTVSYDAIRKLELGSTHSPLGVWMAQHGWIWGPLAAVTLVAELGAPLAVVWARLGR